MASRWMMDVLSRTTMKATAKCDQHCQLQDSMNHWKFERILFFRVRLEHTPDSYRICHTLLSIRFSQLVTLAQISTYCLLTVFHETLSQERYRPNLISMLFRGVVTPSLMFAGPDVKHVLDPSSMSVSLEFVISIFVDGLKMDVLVRTTMKATAKCDKHHALLDSVNHLTFERILLFRVVLEHIPNSCFVLIFTILVFTFSLMVSRWMFWFEQR